MQQIPLSPFAQIPKIVCVPLLFTCFNQHVCLANVVVKMPVFFQGPLEIASQHLLFIVSNILILDRFSSMTTFTLFKYICSKDCGNLKNNS
jgi:hypothetical protein